VGLMDKTVQSWGETVRPLSASRSRPHNRSQVGIFSPPFDRSVSLDFPAQIFPNPDLLLFSY
jgi:hypothetical protein